MWPSVRVLIEMPVCDYEGVCRLKIRIFRSRSRLGFDVRDVGNFSGGSVNCFVGIESRVEWLDEISGWICD